MTKKIKLSSFLFWFAFVNLTIIFATYYKDFTTLGLLLSFVGFATLLVSKLIKN